MPWALRSQAPDSNMLWAFLAAPVIVFFKICSQECHGMLLGGGEGGEMWFL